MPRVATKPRSAAQLANDERLRSRAPAIHVRKNITGPEDVDPPQTNINISTSGDAEAEIEVIAADKFRAKAEDEAFMNEMVEIEIESTDDPTEPLFVHTGHQGITQYIKRGTPQTIKRKFLYSIVAAKKASLVCAFGKDANGQEFNRLSGPSSPTLRVVVLNDTPRGREAYKAWMQQK